MLRSSTLISNSHLIRSAKNLRFYATAVFKIFFYINVFLFSFLNNCFRDFFKPTVKLWIDNKQVESKTKDYIDLFNPVSRLKQT